MKVLLTHSYFLRLDPKQWNTGKPYPPLGTLYAAAVLQKQAHDVYFHDVMFDTATNNVINKIDETASDVFIIYDDGFNYLTKMCLTNMREAAFEMIAYARSKNCRIIISSSDSTDRFEQYLEAGADFILLGEAEETLIELLNNLDVPDQVLGIAFRRNNSIIKNQRRALISDLDTVPFPAWQLLNVDPYRKMWLKSSGYFSINLATTRGCPFKCNWCAKPIYGNRYHSRSPENVVSEIQLLKQLFDFDHIWFCDDIFGLKPGWIKQFASLLRERSLKIKFKIQARADLLVVKETIASLSDAGCETVWMGAESGSQKILDAMDKGTTVKQIAEATRTLRDFGIQPCFFIQFGYPEETQKDIQLTIKMINTLLPHELGISVSYPLPGTVFFEKVRTELQHKSNWTDSDELALMFKNTYQPAFYKQLHKYVHKTYRRHIALQQLKNLVIHPRKADWHSFRKAFSIIYYGPSSIFNKLKLNRLQHASIA